MIKQAILKALQQFPVEFTEETVAELERKVNGRQAVGNVAGYAYVAARNWAIDRLRRQAYRAKLRAEEVLAAERDRLEHERVSRLRQEFEDIVCELLRRGVFPAQEKQLAIVRLACFDSKSDDEYASAFPGTNAPQRYQWRCRGIKLASRHGSEGLREFLNERKWQN